MESLSTDGQKIVVGVPHGEGNHGRMHLYEKRGREWSTYVVKVPNDNITYFGSSVAIHQGMYSRDF